LNHPVFCHLYRNHQNLFHFCRNNSKPLHKHSISGELRKPTGIRYLLPSHGLLPMSYARLILGDEAPRLFSALAQ
jgi:hypothetical protein